MIKSVSKDETRRRIHTRIRKRIGSQSPWPRLNVYRSTQHIYAQIIDDRAGRTLASASSVDSSVKASLKSGGNVAAAKTVGQVIAERAKSAGIERVVFDRGGYGYHGRVKAFADAAREGGLKF